MSYERSFKEKAEQFVLPTGFLGSDSHKVGSKLKFCFLGHKILERSSWVLKDKNRVII